MKVGVMLGGLSTERAVSLITGRAVYDNLDRKKYTTSLIEMDKNGRFFLISQKGKKVELDLQNKDRKLFDLIFIALHGPGGEDGCAQGMLQAWNIPYTGSGVLASAIAMNKVYAANIYRAHGLPTPPLVEFTRESWYKQRGALLKRIEREIGYPSVVKPVNQGSAIGVSIVKNKQELSMALDKTFKLFLWLMIQKFIKGKEATCGVLERKGKIFALPPTHILPKLGQFYDYKSKYQAGGSSHICPEDFSKKINKEIQKLARQAHRTLGCRGMSRTDIFVADDGKLYLIETNTIPGMTPTSLFPEAAAQAGISFSRMLDLIIAASS